MARLGREGVAVAGRAGLRVGHAAAGEEGSGGAEFPPELAALVPENIDLIYWDYYAGEQEFYDGMLKAHKNFGRHIVFAGGAWSWVGFAPLNGLSVKNSKLALQACRENGVDDIFITSWKDDGSESSLFCNLPSLFACAEYARGNFDDKAIAQKFGKLFGIAYEDYMTLDLPNICLSGKDGVLNPCKYMLYSDPFFGFLDCTVAAGGGKKFAATAKKLEKFTDNKEFGYLFRTLADLCRAVKIKYDLGVRTREAYAEGREAVAALLPDYKKAIKRIEKFYESFREQWDNECKENGFENHDVRLGGLIRRLEHCRKMLSDYAEGRRAAIPSLEEKILPFPFADSPCGVETCFNTWSAEALIHQ